eukprot:6304446-Amphidinium_carterae.1
MEGVDDRAALLPVLGHEKLQAAELRTRGSKSDTDLQGQLGDYRGVLKGIPGLFSSSLWQRSGSSSKSALKEVPSQKVAL